MRTAWIVLVLSAGCSVDKEAFPKQAAKIACGQFEKCNLGYFESVYGDMQTCKTDMATFSEDLIYFMESGLACEYDAKEAGICLRDLSDMSCEELYEIAGIEDACADAFTGCMEE
jgi:hypothetical protein